MGWVDDDQGVDAGVGELAGDGAAASVVANDPDAQRAELVVGALVKAEGSVESLAGPGEAGFTVDDDRYLLDHPGVDEPAQPAAQLGAVEVGEVVADLVGGQVAGEQRPEVGIEERGEASFEPQPGMIINDRGVIAEAMGACRRCQL